MNLRRIAAQVLVKVIQDGQSLTAALDTALAKINDGKDRGFVQALCFGVIRHYFELTACLHKLLDKPLKEKDADIQALLLLGLYQLRHMRVKPHAAVSETVAANSKNKLWAKGLINGVLRNYQREAETLATAIASHREAQCNHPDWLIRRIEGDWPQQAAQILAANNAAPPMTLRSNLRQNSRADYLALLAEQGIAAYADSTCDTAIHIEPPVSVERLPGFFAGRASVQDAAAQLAAVLLDVQPGHRVLDLCAAPGGKTAAILERQPALASMLAVDIDANRLKRVNDNLQRLQLQAETLAADACQPENWAADRRFERILLDAPCSGLGVIRRHPDIKLLRRDSDIAQLQTLQGQILDSAWTLLAPGGELLYATCSILKQENELQIARFLANHNDADHQPIVADWGIERPYGRQILTGSGQMDGFYYAKLRKSH